VNGRQAGDCQQRCNAQKSKFHINKLLYGTSATPSRLEVVPCKSENPSPTRDTSITLSEDKFPI
jgi:hypothetical protein